MLIKEYVASGKDGRCNKRSAYEHALLIARIALSNGAEPQDTETFLEMLFICIQEAIERDDEVTRISYGGELVARIDRLVDAGDEGAGVWLATVMPTVDPQILETAQFLQRTWSVNEID